MHLHIDKNFATILQRELYNLTPAPFHHDWYIYAFARKNNFKWHIDNQPNIYYRQHSSNQVGANIGFKQAINRIKILKNKQYQKDVIDIIKSIEKKHSKEIISKVKSNPFHFRRNPKEAILLWIFHTVGWI